MKKYINPYYEVQAIETEDVMTASSIKDEGVSTLGNITGNKASFASDFDSLLNSH